MTTSKTFSRSWKRSYNAIYSMQEACECITSAINNLEEIE